MSCRATINRFSPIAVLVLIFSLISGCNGSKPAAESSAESVDANQDVDSDRCEKRLLAALQKLQPEAMATNSRRENVVNSLNSWLTNCAADAAKDVQVSEANAAMLSPAARRFATAARFTENDCLYIRDCFILRAMTESAWKQADADADERVATDRKRVVHLFENVVRSVVLMAPDENRVPVGIFEILLTGRGTIDDRVWIFCEALRQRQLDAFIIIPTSPAAEDASSSDIPASADLLIGVAVESEVLLFDPLRGTAVPKKDDPALLIADPAGLDSLKEYERWAKPTIRVVAEPGSFAPRMLLLQEQMPAAGSAMLYEELAGGTSEIRPLVDRLVDAGNGLWDKAAISLWEYPEKSILAAGALNEEQKKAYQLLLKPYDAPFERDPLKSDQLLDDPGKSDEQMTEEQKMERRMMMLQERVERISQSSDEVFGKASQRLLKVRLEQVMGLNDVQMIQQLQQIRIASMQDFVEIALPVGDNKEALYQFPLPEAIRLVHRRATGDSLYWTAMCQLVRTDFGAAATTLRNYRRQYPDDKWKYASMFNEAVALIRLGGPDAALLPLKEADVEQNPERIQAAWLLSRMTAAGIASTVETAPASEEETATETEKAADAAPAATTEAVSDPKSDE